MNLWIVQPPIATAAIPVGAVTATASEAPCFSRRSATRVCRTNDCPPPPRRGKTRFARDAAPRPRRPLLGVHLRVVVDASLLGGHLRHHRPAGGFFLDSNTGAVRGSGWWFSFEPFAGRHGLGPRGGERGGGRRTAASGARRTVAEAAYDIEHFVPVILQLPPTDTLDAFEFVNRRGSSLGDAEQRLVEHHVRRLIHFLGLRLRHRFSASKTADDMIPGERA